MKWVCRVTAAFWLLFAGFLPITAQAQTIGGNGSISVTTGGQQVQLPASTSSYPWVLITPAPGTTTTVFYLFGGSSVAATTSSPALPGGGICRNVGGPNGYLSAITGTGTATIYYSQMTSCPDFSGGGGSGAAPIGVAGGDLGGTYPNPTVINGLHITNASIPNSGLATPAPCSAFGTTAGTCAQGGVITGGGPTGSATVAPIITYNAAGQLTTVSSATITPAIGSVTGLGTGVSTLLGGNSSGTGGPAGTTSPTFTTPVLGVATATSLAIGAGSAITSSGAGGALGTGAFAAAAPCSAFGTTAGTCVQGNGGTVSVNLYSSGVLFLFPSSGSIGNNGALSGITAISSNAAQGYAYFPSGAIASGSAAGWYWTVFSSTTAGTIYNNTYTSGIPVVPPSPTAFATTGSGNYTQTTGSYVAGPTVTVPAGVMGISGSVRVVGYVTMPNNANNKFIRTIIGTGNSNGYAMASFSSHGFTLAFRNQGSASAQTFQLEPLGQDALLTTSVNTANAQTLTLNFFLGTATDYLLMTGLTVAVDPQ